MVKVINDYCLKYDTISEEEKIKRDSINEKLNKKKSMLDWLDIETTISNEELILLKNYASIISTNADILLVIGIGGSYLGSKAIIDALKPYFTKNTPEIIFLGYNLSAEYIEALLEYIKGKNIYVNVISKSGNTLETNISFNIIYKYLKDNDPNYRNKIIVTSNNKTGKLLELAKKDNLKLLTVPDNIGGRFSVLSVVGLLPMLVSGINIYELLRGAKDNRNCFDEAFHFALIRHHLELDSKIVEAITYYEEKLTTFSSWYQQLFAETEAKNGMGILPIPNPNTTNLHSIGQYLQDGSKNIFETVIKITNLKDSNIKYNNHKLNELNNLIINPVALAHLEGNTPSIILEINKLDEYNLGSLIYFLEVTATIGAYLLDVDPFNQPGVELYKDKISKIL